MANRDLWLEMIKCEDFLNFRSFLTIKLRRQRKKVVEVFSKWYVIAQTIDSKTLFSKTHVWHFFMAKDPQQVWVLSKLNRSFSAICSKHVHLSTRAVKKEEDESVAPPWLKLLRGKAWGKDPWEEHSFEGLSALEFLSKWCQKPKMGQKQTWLQTVEDQKGLHEHKRHIFKGSKGFKWKGWI